MQLPDQRHLATVAEYLRYEATATSKHEYRDGEVVAMAGSGTNHSRIASNAIRRLGNALDGKPCEVFESNQRIGLRTVARFFYPDLSVICGPVQYDPHDNTRQTATNPKLLVEILSPSTEACDRGEKFNRYQTIESLEEYVLISQDTPRIEIFRRQSEGTWLFTTVSGLENCVRLQSIQIEISLAEVYARVEFPPEIESPV